MAFRTATVRKRSALAARERVLGLEHPDTLISVNHLAFLYKRQGRYTDAEPLYLRALEGWTRVLGSEHPHTRIVRENLEHLRASTGAPRRDDAARKGGGRLRA